MKKIKRLVTIITIALFFCLSFCLLSACEFSGDPAGKLNFVLNDDGESYSVFWEGIGEETEIIIPSTYNDLPVTAILDNGFSSCEKLINITIPEGITSIGRCAFATCLNLTSIIIPDSVVFIGEEAFICCIDLKNISIGGRLTEIKANVFGGCSSLVSITIPDSVTSIGEGAFSGCTSLTNITLGSSLLEIDSMAFEGCYKLKEVYNKSSLNLSDELGLGLITYGLRYVLNVYTPTSGQSYLKTTSNELIFYDDENLCCLVAYCGSETELTLPETFNGKTYIIFDYAFFNCSSLKSIIIPTNITKIEQYTFSNCTNLESINIHDNITAIGDEAFSHCSSLKSVTIPNSVNSIGLATFFGCTNLSSINIFSDKITTIGQGAFRYTAYYDNENNWEDGVLYIGKYLIYSKNSSNTCVVKEGTLTIADGAFYKKETLTNITISNSVKAIGMDAFYGCSNLTNIVLGNSVTLIDNMAFANCVRLRSISIPSSVISIKQFVIDSSNSLEEIKFEGTIEDWLAITKDEYWNFGSSNFAVICTDGMLDKNGEVVNP